MAIVLDLLVVAVIVLFFIIGYKRGFGKTVIQLVGSIVAIILAFMLSKPVSNGAYNLLMAKPIQKIVANSIDIGSNNAEKITNDIMTNIPGFASNMLEQKGAVDKIKNSLSGKEGKSSVDIAKDIESEYIRPVATVAISPIITLLLFILFSALLSILSKALDIIHIPGLKQLNSWLGAVIGILNGVVVIFIGVSILSVMSFTVKPDNPIARKTINDTIIVKRIENINPSKSVLSDLGINI